MSLLERLVYHLKSVPNKLAITGSYGTLTYGQLDDMTERIARKIRSGGIGKEDVVTIETDNKYQAIVLLLSVVRAGAAYCMIPNDYPEHRKSLMREKVKSKLTLRDLEVAEVQMLPENDGLNGELPTARDENSLLYIIFTSGSTGEPKAVAIEDRAIWKIVNHNDFYRGQVIGQFAPLEFDASVYELFGGLLNGMTLRMVNKDESLDFDVMPDILEEIDTVFLTTRLFNLYVDECLDSFSKLKLVLTGGERCSIRHLQEAARYCKVLNVYGPTETTVYATKYEVRGDEAVIPIGKLFDKGKFRIVDEQGRDVEPGNQGELLISDSGLLRHYLGNEGANAAVFAQHDRIVYYRTGDIVYENSDNDLVYVERKDRQVKISGYRIELGEIEECARAYGLHKDCVAHYDGKRLYLYVTDTVELELLRQYLRSRLPDYMIPTVKVVEQIPMNANGKTDMNAIKVEQVNDSKNKLIEVIEGVLKSKIVMESTFIELGGDSIKAMEIIWKLGGDGYQLDLDMLFNQTLGEIVEHAKAS
ncbi:non-ribosomal peptide synthetase [Paenibacillus sp. GSMTC-2017]|nr:non-ribosomal peptide synthetase [Paenibacillus sp. GSMTC-2017]